MIAVMRHGDRTPKQKMKMVVTHERLSIMCIYTELMIITSHQTFTGQYLHLTGQNNFDQTNLLYIRTLHDQCGIK